MKYIIGNWKMNLNIRESAALARGVARFARGKEFLPGIVLCPTFVALSEVRKILARGRIMLGAQNCGPDKNGAYTGEVSPAVLKDIGVNYVILGHSERRQIMGESNELIARKVRAALEAKLIPIVCIGESEEIRLAGNAQEYIHDQLHGSLSGVTLGRHAKIFIAYEPSWAIGSHHSADIASVLDMHAYIRKETAKILNTHIANINVVYGGSVDDQNAYSFLRENEVDGILVGGASLSIHRFDKILTDAMEIISAQQAL
ncbi:triose-phosphate isomerase [Candidatus Parcubacteria bacterium]|nr:MAG: triose-phosphate isomerase [Candidatus Parcubacteria bacterium]